MRSASSAVLRLVSLVAVLGLAGPSAAVAAQVVVICNPAVQLSPAEVRDVFVGDKTFAGSLRLVPVDNAAQNAAFLDKVLKLNAAKYSSLWTKKAFREGVNPPPLKANDAEVIAFVRSTAGACSYVASEAAGVVVIAKY